MIATSVSVAALMLWCAAVVVLVEVWRQRRSVARRAGALALVMVMTTAAVLPVDSLVGDLRTALDPEPPDLQLLSGQEGTVTFVLFPTIMLDAEQTFSEQIPMLRQYGHVLLIDYPARNYDAALLNRAVFAFIRRHSLPQPYVIGASFGVHAAIEFVRYYVERPDARQPIAHFMAVSGPVDGRDVRTPLPLWLSQLINGGPLSQALYTRLYDTAQDLQYAHRPLAESVRRIGPDVSRAQLAQAYRASRTYDVRGLLSRLQALVSSEGLRHGEFAGVPATILWVSSAEGDYLIKGGAVHKLGAGFPDHQIRTELPGHHANFIEWGSRYTSVMEEVISGQLGVRLEA